MSDRLYCTVNEILGDLQINGVKDEAGLMQKIRAASDVIDRRGWFIPQTETRRFDGPNHRRSLLVDPLLAVTSITDDATALASTDYLLYPRNRHWPGGPYTRIEIDPDASSLTAWTREQDIVAIAGRWGLYEETLSTGATVSSQTDSSTSLVVNTGAPISPGAVLLIDSEQELVAATGAATDSTADTSEAVDLTEQEIDVTNGALLNIGEVIRIDTEKMRVTDIASNTLVVQRGYAGSTIATHASGAGVEVYRTFTVKRAVNGTTAAAHTNAAIGRYVPPYSIGYLCIQIAALMHKKAQSGYAGKVGSIDTGEVFYLAEFPDDPLKKIMKGYSLTSL
jgi:hypothetical protein